MSTMFFPRKKNEFEFDNCYKKHQTVTINNVQKPQF